MQAETPWPQEIRIAMTMVGGASLAVWMGGIATETSALLHASRGPDGKGAYREILDLVNATVSLDVLTGTSAGGINAACLGLAEAYGSTPGVLRDTWLEVGSLENLIRDPAQGQPRSVLDGDGVLLAGLADALRDITGHGTAPAEPPDITVLLTGTMIDGETARFDDALGNLVRDSEHRLLFRFDGPLWTNGVVEPLALAARSSASFPGAFELSSVPVGAGGADALHPDMAGYTDVSRSHWLTDGGVLLNKPLQPALREIFERPARQDVRRLMLYVVPTAESEAARIEVDPTCPPLLGGALSHVVGAVMCQSISAEIEELTRHNDAVTKARGTRVSLAALGNRTGAANLVDQKLMDDYRQRRVQEDATALVRETTRWLDRADGGKLGRQWASGASMQLREAAIEGLCDGLPEKPPGRTCGDETVVAFRTTALDDAVATGLQLLNAGFQLGLGPDQARQLNESRSELHEARQLASRGVRLADWIVQQQPPGPDVVLAEWIKQFAASWAAQGRQAKLTDAWPMVTGALRGVEPVLRTMASTATGEDADTVTTLLDWLQLTEADPVVNARLLTLHVAVRGLLAQSPSVDQRVDLVQVSADSRSLLDMKRMRAKEKLTGPQANDFGAFYKSSWRASDWMWGRVDGAGWLIQCLLEPKRLAVLRDLEGPEVFRYRVRKTFTSIGWSLPSPADGLSAEEAAAMSRQLGAELAFLGLDAQLADVLPSGEPPTSLPVTAMVLARSRQLDIAREELPVIASQAGQDAEVAQGNGNPSAAFRKLMATPPVDDESTRRAFQACQVSAERLAGERGSMLLARTLIKGGAAGINAVTGAADLPRSVKPAAMFAQSTGRAAWWITQGVTRLSTPWNFVAALVTMLAGVVLGNQGNAVLQVLGLPIAAGALVFLLVTVFAMRRTWHMLLMVLTVLAGACFLFAGFIPPVREHLFPWLGSVMAAWSRGESPLWWLVVAALLILPAVLTPLGALWRRLPRRH